MMGRQSIAIVDDTPANLKLLENMLREQGYRVLAFPRGDFALRGFERNQPDLILLDINMPGIDGFELCRKLKENEKLRDIPVIFISAYNETIDKVKAFSVGGVDYVTKPFQFEEVIARITTHLKISNLQRELARKFKEQKELEELKDNLIHMIVHDMRSPLQGMLGYLELLQNDSALLGETHRDYVNMLEQSGKMLINMISDLLDVTRLEKNNMPISRQLCDMRTIIEQSIKNLGYLAENRIDALIPESKVMLMCDRELITRVVVNIVGNALKYEPVGMKVRIACSQSENNVSVSIADDGPGIPEEYHQKIFEKFGQLSADGGRKPLSSGLGLTFARLAVEAHGGNIALTSEMNKGSTFTFELPKGYE
ncbi:MAG TPA: response regulator [Phycisphaerae bacterium]|nr:response regulator [Phycisphaerae bacterium]HPS53439.1 response regulator [Phycisphaerae bacterium]